MSRKGALTRLQKELVKFHDDPPPLICVSVREKNMLDWFYLLKGPEDTPYAGGEYYGRVRFPPEYPFAPPEIVMYTPSGRFKEATPLCLSMSNFHPETWNPAWSVSTILQGLQSFMVEDTLTQGSIHPLPSEAERRALAAKSRESNLACKLYCELFPNGFTRDLVIAGEESEGEGEGEEEKAPTESTSAKAEEDAKPAAPAPEAPASASAVVEVGAAVRLEGMAARPDLNGKRGVVEAIERGRVKVKVDGGEVVKVRQNVVKLA